MCQNLRAAPRTRPRQPPRAKPARAKAPSSLSARTRWLALAVLCVTVLIANLDNTVLNVALPTLVRDLHASTSDLQWIVDSYIIVFAGLLLAAGSLADRIGRKKTFLAGLVIFAVGSAAAAFSGGVSALIAARAGMGVGGALMIPSTLSIISNMFRRPGRTPARHRPVGRYHRRRCRPRPDHRRAAAGPLLVGLGLPDQRAHRRGRPARRPLAGAGLEERRTPRPPTSLGAVLSIAGIGADAVVDHRGARPRLVVAAGDRRRRGRPGGAGRLRRLGTDHRPPDAQPGLLPAAVVRGRDPGGRRGDLRAVRGAVRAHPVPAVLPRLHAAAGGRPGAAGRGRRGRHRAAVGPGWCGPSAPS